MNRPAGGCPGRASFNFLRSSAKAFSLAAIAWANAPVTDPVPYPPGDDGQQRTRRRRHHHQARQMPVTLDDAWHQHGAPAS
jgi:hypothetical protein